MGNTNCVASGATPHLMEIKITNGTHCELQLDTSRRCNEKYCGRHSGFGVLHGKFVQGWEPNSTINPTSSETIRVSGREGSAVNPDGWIQYKMIDPYDGTQICTVVVDYDSGGWTSFQNRSHLKCYIQDQRKGYNVTREVNQIENRKFELSVELDGFDKAEDGDRALNLWNGLSNITQTLGIEKASQVQGKTIVITDNTSINAKKNSLPYSKQNAMLNTLWWLGANIVGHFNVSEQSNQSDGFKQAIENVAKKLKEGDQIGELQFFCHGGKGQKVCGGDAYFQIDYLRPLIPFTRSHSRIWFRCCSCLAGIDENGLGPSKGATQFAQRIINEIGFGYVAGHTTSIGEKIDHPECYAFINSKWVGPRRVKGKAIDRLHDYFDL